MFVPMNGLLSTKSYKALVPIRNDPTILPRWIFFLLLVTHPLLTRSITPPLNISEWIPKSLWLVNEAKTASGMLPIPVIEKK